MPEFPLKIGITCYPTVGGSGVIATELGRQLAQLGHEIHFISYERPFRLPLETPGIFFHPVEVNQYGLFKYPDYTLPLSVKMAEVSREFSLDILHVHYAVPHATAALLACAMLPAEKRPRVVTTLHGTDTTLLARDRGYAPAIRHALTESDAVTAVSKFLQQETQKVLQLDRDIEVIPNFFEPRPALRPPEIVRTELGLRGETLLIHLSNLRRLKRIELLLQSFARIQNLDTTKLLILAGGDFAPYEELAGQLGVREKILVRENITDIEDYLQVADIGVFTSETESFCLSILEAMAFGCPSVSTAVGGIPELVEHNRTGLLVPTNEPKDMARAIDDLIADPLRRENMGTAARKIAEAKFSAAQVVPQYLELYRRTLRNGN